MSHTVQKSAVVCAALAFAGAAHAGGTTELPYLNLPSINESGMFSTNVSDTGTSGLDGGINEQQVIWSRDVGEPSEFGDIDVNGMFNNTGNFSPFDGATATGFANQSSGFFDRNETTGQSRGYRFTTDWDISSDVLANTDSQQFMSAMNGMSNSSGEFNIQPVNGQPLFLLVRGNIDATDNAGSSIQFNSNTTGAMTLNSGDSINQVFQFDADDTFSWTAGSDFFSQLDGFDGDGSDGASSAMDFEIRVVPTPAAAALFGLAGLAASRRRRA